MDRSRGFQFSVDGGLGLQPLALPHGLKPVRSI